MTSLVPAPSQQAHTKVMSVAGIPATGCVVKIN